MFEVFYAPEKLPPRVLENPSVFLAGSIEMGVADNWQVRATKALATTDVAILNPRRDDWDSSWVQSIDNAQFREQVEWELNGLDIAWFILMYFDPNTKSPISLLELGRHVNDEKLIVVCPEGFWRKGNVDVVCEYHNIPQFDTIEDAVNHIKNVLTK